MRRVLVARWIGSAFEDGVRSRSHHLFVWRACAPLYSNALYVQVHWLAAYRQV